MHLIEAIVRQPSEETTKMHLEKNSNEDPPPHIVNESEGPTSTTEDSVPPQDVPSNSSRISEEPIPEDEHYEEEKVEDEFVVNSEELAIADAIASANASYVPPAAVMHDPTPEPLLASIDGPSLSSYDHNPSTYTARNIPIAVRSKLTVPIYVTNSGSIVEYALESKYYDVGFGIEAEREDGATTVVELGRVDSHLTPITGRFLVITVPCALVFTFDNEYSWFREKNISYRITITPPDLKHLMNARKVRADIALHFVQDDKQVAEKRLEKVALKRTTLLEEIEFLEKEISEKRKALHAVTNEEEWLLQRVALRRIQEEEIHKRKVREWADEPRPTDAGSEPCEI